MRWRRRRPSGPGRPPRPRDGLAGRDAGAGAFADLEPEPSEVIPVRSAPLDAPLWGDDEPETVPRDEPAADDPARPAPASPPADEARERQAARGDGLDAQRADGPAVEPQTPRATETPRDASSPAGATLPGAEPSPPADLGPTTRSAPAPAVGLPVRRSAGRPPGPLPGDAELDHALLVSAGREAVRRALDEDLDVDGDVTSLATVPPDAAGRADLVARAEGIVAGTALVAEVFDQLDPRVTVELTVRDGDRVRVGQQLGKVTGPLRSILTGERTALNFLTHLSGIATRTRAFADAVEGTGCVVRDTRKTTPGLRLLEKAAVRAGGGTNHRIGLFDALLVKDNHVVAAGSVAEATRRALQHAAGRHVQVEVRSSEELREAVAAGARDVLLDNLGPEETAAAVARCRELEADVGERILLESSGRVTLETVRSYAEAGIDRAAVGALTHSAPQLDIALDVRSEHRTPTVRLYDAPLPGRYDDDELFDPATPTRRSRPGAGPPGGR